MSDLLDIHNPKEIVVDNEPWLRMPGETSRGYGAFLTYRNLPTGQRTLRKAAEIFYIVATRAKVRQMQTWSARFMWVDRVLAWDDALAKQAQDDLIRKVRELNDKHIQAAQSLYAKAIQKITGVEPDDLSPMDALKYLTESIDIERLALGQPTEMEAASITDTTEVTFGEMTDKELVQKIIQLRIKRGVKNVSRE